MNILTLDLDWFNTWERYSPLSEKLIYLQKLLEHVKQTTSTIYQILEHHYAYPLCKCWGKGNTLINMDAHYDCYFSGCDPWYSPKDRAYYHDVGGIIGNHNFVAHLLKNQYISSYLWCGSYPDKLRENYRDEINSYGKLYDRCKFIKHSDIFKMKIDRFIICLSPNFTDDLDVFKSWLSVCYRNLFKVYVTNRRANFHYSKVPSVKCKLI